MIGDYGTFHVAYTQKVDIAYISTRLRSQDMEEVPSGVTAYDALDVGRMLGSSYTLFYNDLPIMIFGSVPDDGFANIWMVGTPDISKIRRELLTYGKKFAMNLIGEQPYGANYVWTGNYQSLRWLKFIGAEFGDTIIIDNKEFKPFKLFKQCVPH